MDACDGHIELAVSGAPTGTTQAVPSRKLSDGTFLILHSPGLVQGIAADDVIRLSEGRQGRFEVVRRGGNLCIQVFRAEGVGPVVEWVLTRLAPLSGRLDGSLERAAVFTIPVTSGFGAIEEVLAQAMKTFPGLEWYYGNVYAEDGRTPLNWWQSL